MQRCCRSKLSCILHLPSLDIHCSCCIAIYTDQPTCIGDCQGDSLHLRSSILGQVPVQRATARNRRTSGPALQESALMAIQSVFPSVDSASSTSLIPGRY